LQYCIHRQKVAAYSINTFVCKIKNKNIFYSCLDCIIEGEFPVLDEAILDIILLAFLFLNTNHLPLILKIHISNNKWNLK